MVWFAEALVIIFEFNEYYRGVVTINHTPLHDVVPGAPLLKCFIIHPCLKYSTSNAIDIYMTVVWRLVTKSKLQAKFEMFTVGAHEIFC